MTERQAIYNNWSRELEYRGTNLIQRKVQVINGYCLSPSTSVSYTLNSDIVLNDKDFLFECDIKFINFSSKFLMSGTDKGVSIIDGTEIDFLYGSSTYKLTGIDLSQYTDIVRFKFMKFNTKLLFYINNDKIGELSIEATNVYNINTLLVVDDRIANVRLTTYKTPTSSIGMFEKEEVYMWACNEGSGLFVGEISGYTYSLKAGVEIDSGLTSVWCQDNDFNNVKTSDLDGELLRLTDYSEGEMLLELVGNSELGMCLDRSSWMSQEASCVNLNKAYEKGVVRELSKYPLHFTSANGTFAKVDSEFIRFMIETTDTTPCGINVTLLGNPDWKTNDYYTPVGLTKFMPIPVAGLFVNPYTEELIVDDLVGYEVSFRIKSNANIDLTFSLKAYDRNLNYWMGGFDEFGSAGSNTDDFLRVIDFGLCNGTEIWIRGVVTLKNTNLDPYSTVDRNLNIGIGNNLSYANENVKYIVPVISFNNHVPSGDTIAIRDIVVRPLELPKEKGVVGNKNTVIGYLKNKRGENNQFIYNFIDDKLIPVNCGLNVKFL